ncbi:hypothetical protein Ancab_035350 [Ancistrocladus abbreviatus]
MGENVLSVVWPRFGKPLLAEQNFVETTGTAAELCRVGTGKARQLFLTASEGPQCLNEPELIKLSIWFIPAQVLISRPITLPLSRHEHSPSPSSNTPLSRK